MFAIVEAGGIQHKVVKGSVVSINRVDSAEGEVITLGNTLCFMDTDGTCTFGSPLLDGVTVSAKIVEHFRADKVLIFKKRRRKNSRRLNGHRQDMTKLVILDILRG